VIWHYVAGALVVLATGFTGGWQVRGWKATADERERQEAQVELERMQRRRAAMAAEQYETGRAAAGVRERTVVKEVRRVVEKPVYRDVCLDADGLRILTDDAAASNARRQLAPAVPPASGPR
jgi:hypothetical protein